MHTHVVRNDSTRSSVENCQSAGHDWKLFHLSSTDCTLYYQHTEYWKDTDSSSLSILSCTLYLGYTIQQLTVFMARSNIPSVIRWWRRRYMYNKKKCNNNITDFLIILIKEIILLNITQSQYKCLYLVYKSYRYQQWTDKRNGNSWRPNFLPSIWLNLPN